MFFYPVDSKILETWILISSFKYFRVIRIEKQIRPFLFWENLWLNNFVSRSTDLLKQSDTNCRIMRLPHHLKRKEFEKFNIFPGMGQRLSWTCSLIQTRIWPNLDSWSQCWCQSRWTSYHWKNIRQQRSSAGNRIQLNPTQIMKNRFHDTTNYVIFTFWVYNLHPVSYTMITKILSRKYKTILYIIQLLLQVIFKDFDAFFLQLNKNMTIDCHWVYAFCTSNCLGFFKCM